MDQPNIHHYYSEDKVPHQEDVTNQYLVFRYCGKRFAIRLLDLRTIIPLRRITPVPGSPSAYLGIISLRGSITPILNFSSILELEPGNEITDFFVIVKDGTENIGFPVQQINGLATLQTDDILPVSDYVTGEHTDLYSGVFKYNNHFGLIINFENILMTKLGSTDD